MSKGIKLIRDGIKELENGDLSGVMIIPSNTYTINSGRYARWVVVKMIQFLADMLEE